MKRWLLLFSLIISILAFTAVLAEDAETPEPTETPEIVETPEPTEPPVVATDTDLGCPHDHIETLYYFDNPAYTRLDDETHRVYGTAIVDTVCTDCGEVLSSETRRDAEQIRRHSFKNGVCALCGAREPEPADSENPAPAEEVRQSPFVDVPGEHTVLPEPENPEDPEDQVLVLVLTEQELASLEEQEYETLVIRPKEYKAAIALPIAPLRQEAAAGNSDLRAEIEQGEDGAVFAALRLQGGELPPDFAGSEQIELRFYQTTNPPTIHFYPESAVPSVMEQPSSSVIPEPPADPYCVIPWLGNGTYSPIIY